MKGIEVKLSCLKETKGGSKMNSNMLMAEIKLNGLKMKDFLLKIQKQKGTWSKKIRGITEFSRSKMNEIIKVLHLADEKVMAIFLPQKLLKRNKKRFEKNISEKQKERNNGRIPLYVRILCLLADGTAYFCCSCMCWRISSIS